MSEECVESKLIEGEYIALEILELFKKVYGDDKIKDYPKGKFMGLQVFILFEDSWETLSTSAVENNRLIKALTIELGRCIIHKRVSMITGEIDMRDVGYG